MPTLSPVFQRKLLRSVEKIAKLVDEQRMNPSDAVAKVAVAEKLSDQHVPVLVQAYNTGQQAEVRAKSAGDGLSQFQIFPVADTTKVLQLLSQGSGPVRKTAAPLSTTCFDAPPPSTLGVPVGTGTGLQKTARAAAPQGPREPEVARLAHPSLAIKSAEMKLQQHLSSRRQTMAGLQEKLAAAYERLAKYFRSRQSVPAAEAAYATSQRLGKLASVAADYFAEGRRSPLLSRPFNASEMPYCEFSQIAKMSQEYAEAQDEVAQLQALAYRHDLLRPRVTKTAAKQPVAGDEVVVASTQKHANLFNPILSAATGSSVASMMTGARKDRDEDLVDDYQSALSDPQHQAELRSLETQATLADLMRNDEVVAAHSPEEVAAAYNEISSLTPALAGQTASLRPLLRRQLSADGLEAFDVEQALKMTKLDGSSYSQNPNSSNSPGTV